MIKLIKNNFKNINIDIIMRVGSILFSNTPKDSDYLCVSKNLPRAKRTKIEYEDQILDVLVLNEKEYKDKINFTNTLPQHSLYNYQLLLAEIVYKDDEYTLLEFDMFNEEVKEKYLKSIAFNYLLTLGKSIQKYFYSKIYTHYYIIMKFYENNSSELTEEMLIDIEKLREKQEGYGNIIDEVDTFLRGFEEEMMSYIKK